MMRTAETGPWHPGRSQLGANLQRKALLQTLQIQLPDCPAALPFQSWEAEVASGLLYKPHLHLTCVPVRLAIGTAPAQIGLADAP